MPKQGFSIGCHKCGNIAVFTPTRTSYLHDQPIGLNHEDTPELICTSEQCGNRMKLDKLHTLSEQEETPCASFENSSEHDA